MTGSLSLGTDPAQTMLGHAISRQHGYLDSLLPEPPSPQIAGIFRRERFEPLLLWQSRVPLGDDGSVEVDVPLNDLVTSFRIVAVATAGAHLFGTGEATIRTTQDLVLRSGLPTIVREGDRFDATFTVRNATSAERQVAVTARIEGLPTGRRTLAIPAGGSKEAVWRVTAPTGIDRLDWDVTAETVDDADRLVAHQTVLPPVPVRVQQATLVQLGEARQELPVAPPARALPDRGGVAVALQRSIAGGLGAMREYMAQYRYTCFEQRASIAVALNDPARWSVLMADIGNSMDNQGLLKYFPSSQLRGSAVLTAYVLTIADAAGFAIPEEDRKRMVRGLSRYLHDTVRRRGNLASPSSTATQFTVLAALARHNAVEQWFDFIQRDVGTDLDLNLLPTSALLDWIDILDRLSPKHAELPVAKSILRTRLNLQGTSLAFSTERGDRLWSSMVSVDSNAARTVASRIADPGWRADMPRMMRGLFGRQQRGRWRNTVANARGAIATARFAATFEATPVAGTSVVRLGGSEHRLGWRHDESPTPVEIPWSTTTLTLSHEGAGAPWGLVEFSAAVPQHRPVASGYRIARDVQALHRQGGRGWRRGDVAGVVLDIDADRDMDWVVVEDPLPPGAVVLGSGLGGDSDMLRGTRERGDGWPVYTEGDLDSYRAYYRYVPKGRLSLRYNVRYNTAGRFTLPPTRVEAMYAPEMHAERPVKPITIK